MKKPYMTGAKPEEMPNEPKMYPGDQKFSSSPGGKLNPSLDNFAEDAQIKPAEQLEHIAVPIESHHILGAMHDESKGMHLNPSNLAEHFMPKFANKEEAALKRQGSYDPAVPKAKKLFKI